MIEKQWYRGLKSIGKKALELLYQGSWLVRKKSDSWGVGIGGRKEMRISWGALCDCRR